MFRNKRRELRRALALPLLALGLTGCTDYAIETTLNPDGGGLRVERIRVSENEDVEASPSDYPVVMHTTAGEGWTHRVEVDADGDTLQVFDRRLSVRDLASWSDLSGSFKIDGTTPEKANRRFGYVRLGDVRFRNALRVGRGEMSDGTRTYTFRETFTWENALDALVEFYMTELDRAVAARYPALSEGQRGEIVGFARARYWVAIEEEGLFDDEGNEDQVLTEVARRTSERGVRVVRVRYPDAAEESLVELLGQVLRDEDRLISFAREMPGLDLALNANVVFRLNMPGRVTDSNAHEREGTTLVWEFGPGDAFRAPVEVYAESVVGG